MELDLLIINANIMKILIDHSGHELLNHGDTSMLQMAVFRLKKLWPEAIIHVITNAENRLAKFCPGTNAIHPETRYAWNQINQLGIFPRRILRIFSDPTHQKILSFERYLCLNWPKLYKSLMTLRVKIRKKHIDVKLGYKYITTLVRSDLVLATGGGYLTDDFKWHAYRVLDTIQFAIEIGKVTALLGQGIGPVNDAKLEQKMCLTLPQVDLISLREKRCGMQILLRQGVQQSKVITTGDDAIEIANRMHKVKLGDRIGVNLRLTSYSEVDSRTKNEIIEILRAFAQRHKSSLIPIPISFHSQGEDIRAIEELIDVENLDFKTDSAFDSPAKIIDRIGDCRVVVTGSYHAGVFALSQGIPVIGLAKSQYYKDKFLGLKDQFGEGCEVLLLDDPLRNQILSSTLESIWSQSSFLKPRLLEAAKKQVEAGQLAYQRLQKLVESQKTPT